MSIQWSSEVKRPNQLEEYSQEHIQDLIKCRSDVVYFAKHFIEVLHPVSGFIKWEPRPYQLKILDAYQNNRFNIVMASRQVGKSTVSMIYLLWKAMFFENIEIAVLAHKLDAAKDVVSRIKDSYERLPSWMKPGVLLYNRTSIEFENGARIYASATTKNAVRGKSVSILYLDEFAHVAPHIALEFWTANYPTISTGGAIIIVSTPNGVGNLFHKLWKGAQAHQNNFKHTIVDWWEVPGRNELWKEQTIKQLGSVIIFNQEYGNKFIGSINTLIDYNVLENLVGKMPIRFSPNDSVWEDPIKEHSYVIACDAAEGNGGDESVITIFDITMIPWKQVYRYNSNNISTIDLPGLIKQLAEKYNNAWAIVEGNNHGMIVVENLYKTEGYEFIAHMGKRVNDMGVWSHKKSKAEACALMKKAVENSWIEFTDDETINQLLDFGPTRGTYKGINGRDDLSMCVAWVCYFNMSPYFADLGMSNKVEFFDFKTGEAIYDNRDIIQDGRGVTTLSDEDILKLMKELNKPQNFDDIKWLFEQ